MKTLRLFQTVFWALAVFAGFISCEKEKFGGENNGGGTVPVYTGKKLVKLDEIRLSYDTKGRLIKYDYNDGDYESFEYGDDFVKNSVSWDYRRFYKANLNDKGLATSIDVWCTHAGEFCDETKHPHYDGETYSFEYDKYGRLIKLVGYCSIDWDSNGNIASVRHTYGDSPVTFEYGLSPIENKMGFMLSYDELWNVDFDDLDVFTLAKVMGGGTKHLPISRSDGTTFRWTLDKDGYPTSVTICEVFEDCEDTNTITMAWE